MPDTTTACDHLQGTGATCGGHVAAIMHERDELRRALEDIRAKAIDPELLRWCRWKGCLASYDVTTGPTEPGWKSTHHMAVLLCPKHSTTDHWPSYDMNREDLSYLTAKCGCGEEQEVRPSNWDAVLDWWDAHLARVDAR